jgi:hypothetical protein
MTRILPWTLLLILFGAFAVVAFVALRARTQAGRDMPPFSVYSQEKNGLAEAERLLRELGWKTEKLTRPVQQLEPSKEPRLVIMIEPEASGHMPGQEGGIGKPEAKSILRWVEEGNTLVLAGRNVSDLHHELGVVLIADPKAGAAREVALCEAGSYTDDIDRLLVEGRDEVLSSRGLPLWTLDDRPGAVLLKRGRGHVLVMAVPSLWTRRGLANYGNARLLVNLAARHAPQEGPGGLSAPPIYFDEYHHGVRSGGGFWGYLSYHQQHWALLPVLAAVAVAAWAAAVRLGPAVSPPAVSQADAVDYASALARIYEGAGVRHLLAEVAARDFLKTLTRQLGLRRSALPAEVLAAWKRRLGGSNPGNSLARLTHLLHGVTDLRRRVPSESELLTWNREFDRFNKDQISV